MLAALGGDQQHALLRFGEHDFVGGHAFGALGDAVEFNGQPQFTSSPHLAGGAGEAGGAHVLNAEDGAGGHGFEAGFEEELLHEGVAHLDVGALLLGAFGELFARHGGAVDAVAAGLGADVDDGVADAGGLGVEDFVDADQAEGEGVDEGIAGVAGLEAGFAAEVGDAEAVAVAGDAGDDAVEMGGGAASCVVRCVGRLRRKGAEAEGVHDGERAGVHGEDVAQDAADAGGCALVGLDVAGVVVGFDLEGAGPAVADVDDAGVLAGALDDGAGAGGARAAGGQALEVDAGGLVGTVLRPHDGEDAELGERGGAAHQRFDAGVLVGRDAVRLQQRGSDVRWRGGVGCFGSLRRGFVDRLSSRGHSVLIRLSHGGAETAPCEPWVRCAGKLRFEGHRGSPAPEKAYPRG